MGEGRDLLSREEVLGGLPARRARTLVFLIERQAVIHAAGRAVGTMALVGEEAAGRRELAGIEEFATAREGELRRPSIQEIEAAADGWAALVPDAPAIRAAAARALAERHPLDRGRLAGTRSALGLDDERVAAEFERQSGEPIASVFSRPSLPERLGWLASAPGRWLESAPPFWAAAALTFLLSMGQSVVIVPVAVATVGLPIAAASVLVIGLLALASTAAISEATARNAEVRLHGGFFGRLVTSALGGPAGSIPSVLGIATVVLPTVSTFVGLALLLELTVPLPAVAWVLLLGAVGIAIPLGAPRATSFGGLMAFGLLSTALIAVLSAVVLIESAVEGTLVSAPLSPPEGIDPALGLGVIVGVMLAAYSDPVYAVQIGRLVLPSDPDGSGLVRGSIAGMAAFVALTALFSAVLLFAIPAGELAGEQGSALDAVADTFGPAAIVLATVIGLGLFGIRLYGNAIALFDFVDERLPGRPAPRVVLRAGGDRVLLAADDAGGAPALTIAYRGIRDDRPVVALAGAGAGASAETALRDDTAEALDAGGHPVAIELVEFDERILRLALRTELTISYDGDAAGTGPGVAETLLAEDEGARLVAWLVREGGARPVEVAEELGCSIAEARSRLEELVASGRARREGETFIARLGARRGRRLDPAVWTRLGLEEGDEATRAERSHRPSGLWTRILAWTPARSVISSLPTASLAVLSAVLVAAGTASVSGPFRIVGIIGYATIAGVLPPTLLLAARRRTDIAGVRPGGALVGTVPLTCCAVLGLAALILCATVLWSDPIERALAAVAALFALAGVVLAWRHGAFRTRVLVELTQPRGSATARLRTEERGQPLRARITIGGEEAQGAGLELELDRAVTVKIDAHPAESTELRVSAHRFRPGAETASALPVSAELVRGGSGGVSEVRLGELGGTAAFETGGEWTLRIDSSAGPPT